MVRFVCGPLLGDHPPLQRPDSRDNVRRRLPSASVATQTDPSPLAVADAAVQTDGGDGAAEPVEAVVATNGAGPRLCPEAEPELVDGPPLTPPPRLDDPV